MRPRVFSFAKSALRTTKYCGGCKSSKSYSLFSKGNHRGTGLAVQCKDCYRVYHNARMASDPAYVARKRSNKNAWYQQNAERAKPMWRPKTVEWKQANPDKVLGYVHARRARRLTAGGKYSPDDIVDRYEWQRGMCAICRVDLLGEFEIDHILPLALGGSNFPDNLQLLCAPCNGSKGHKHPIDFMRSRGFLL